MAISRIRRARITKSKQTSDKKKTWWRSGDGGNVLGDGGGVTVSASTHSSTHSSLENAYLAPLTGTL